MKQYTGRRPLFRAVMEYFLFSPETCGCGCGLSGVSEERLPEMSCTSRKRPSDALLRLLDGRLAQEGNETEGRIIETALRSPGIQCCTAVAISSGRSL
jgi:hypothetical protein